MRKLIFTAALIVFGGHQIVSPKFLSAADAEPPVEPAFCLGNNRFLHLSRIETAAIAPDGKTLFTLSDLGIYKFDLQTGKETPLAAQSGARNSLSLSPNGSQIATVAGNGIAIFNTADGKLVAKTNNAAGASLAIGTDGKTLIWCESGQLNLWSGGTPKLLGECQPFYDPVYSADRKWMLVPAKTEQDTPGTLELYDLATQKKIATFDAGQHAFGVTEGGRNLIRAAIDPTDQVLATGGRDGSVNLWDLKTHKKTDELKPFAKPGQLPTEFTILIFSSDGKKVFAGGYEGIIHRWNLETKQVESDLKSPRSAITSLNVTDGGKTLVSTCYDGAVRRWDVAADKEIDPPQGYLGALYSHVSPDGKSVLLLDHTGRMDIWDLKTKTIRNKISPSGGAEIERAIVEPMFGFTGDGKQVFLIHELGKVVLWNADSGKKTASFTLPGNTQNAGWLRFCVGSPDSKRLILNLHREQLQAVDAATGKQIWASPKFAPDCMCYPPVFATDGKTMYLGLSINISGTAKLFVAQLDAASGKELARIELSQKSLNDMEFFQQPTISDDQSTLLIAAGIGPPQHVELVDLKSKKPMHNFNLLGDNFQISRDGKTIVGVEFDRAITTFDAANGKKLSSIPVGDGFVFSMQLLPETNQALLTRQGGQACAWNLKAP
jgi:WD40 repeat protein